MKAQVLTSISKEFLNTSVTLKGILAESKAGVCVKLDNDIVFLIYDKSFDDDSFGKIIIATGILREKKFIPDVIITEDGAISQGAPGKQFILEEITKVDFLKK